MLNSNSGTLIHKDDKVIIKEIKKYLSANDSRVLEFKGLIAEMEIDEYKNEILSVARQVKGFFSDNRIR